MTEPRALRPPYKIRYDLGRKKFGGVECPLGVFPAESQAELQEGFESHFLMGDDGADDQCEYRLVLSSDRIFDVVRRLFIELLPEEVLGLYEEFSYDAFRETDTWRSADAVAKDRILQAWETYGEYFIEDGKCGFGAYGEEPMIELFVEEHGTIYLACGYELREQVEGLIAELGIPEVEQLRCIDSYEHQHREILDLDDLTTMDDLDIKFSVIESLGMELSNRDEGGEEGPFPFWIYVELDFGLDAKAKAPSAFMSLGLTATDHAEAEKLVESNVLDRFPRAMISRYLQFYRLVREDIGDEIRPKDVRTIERVGVWYESEAEFWKTT